MGLQRYSAFQHQILVIKGNNGCKLGIAIRLVPKKKKAKSLHKISCGGLISDKLQTGLTQLTSQSFSFAIGRIF